MLTYDDLVSELEEAWIAAGLHEHALIESVVPTAHDRAYKVELFPDHAEPMTDETTPPWVEINFLWSPLHQLRSEEREVTPDPLEMAWTYTVNAYNMSDRSDSELVRLFQRAMTNAFRRYYPAEAEVMEPFAVEVRRFYQGSGPNIQLVSTQLVSTNITDLSDQWNERDQRVLRALIRTEILLASGIIHSLIETFGPAPNGRDNRGSGYRTVDAA